MISYEDKIKVLNSELIGIPEAQNPMYAIQVVYVNSMGECDWMRGESAIIKRAKSHLFENNSEIRIGWYRDHIYSVLLSKRHCFRPIYNVNFNSLPKEVKDKVNEYIDWVLSKDGQDFVKRMLELKSFL